VHEQADATADAPRRVSASVLAALKPTCHLLNFARGDAVDGGALRARYDRKELIGRRAAAAASASTSTPPVIGVDLQCLDLLHNNVSAISDHRRSPSFPPLPRASTQVRGRPA
jgi:hypothetical protein